MTHCTLICGRTTLSQPDAHDVLSASRRHRYCPATRTALCLRNHGRRRRLRWLCSCPLQGTSRGRSGRQPLAHNSKRLRNAANQMMARAISSTGLWRLNIWWPRRSSPISTALRERKEAWADAYRHTPQHYGRDSLWQHVKTGDGQRAGTRALTAWRPAVGSPSSPVRAVMPRILCTTVHATTQDPYATDCR